MWTSALLKGLCELIKFPRDVTHLGIPTMTAMACHTTRNIVIGWKKLGLVIILILRRKTAIVGKMMEIGTLVRMCAVVMKLGTLVWKTAVATELGTPPLIRQTCNLG